MVMHSKSLRERPAMAYEASKCQQTGRCSWFIDFIHENIQILKNISMLFPTTVISASEWKGVDMNICVADFEFNLSQRK